DRTWRARPPETRGEVEIREFVTTWDLPRAWNPLGGPILVSSSEVGEIMDVGEMTVREARQLEGIDEVREGGGAFDTRPVPFGYYRVTYIGTVAHFRERDTGRGGTGGGYDAD